MSMSEPAGAAESPIAAEVVPQLAAAAAQIATAHEEPAPGLDSLWPWTRITVFRVLDRISAAGVPATTLHTVEPVFGAPITERRGWSEGWNWS
jgi:hypothetical protein